MQQPGLVQMGLLRQPGREHRVVLIIATCIEVESRISKNVKRYFLLDKLESVSPVSLIMHTLLSAFERFFGSK